MTIISPEIWRGKKLSQQCRNLPRTPMSGEAPIALLYGGAQMMPIPGYILIAPVCETGDFVLYRATRTLGGCPS